MRIVAEKEKDILEETVPVEEVKETDGAEEMPEESAEKIPEENGEEKAPDGEKDPEGEAPAREKEKKGFRKKSREDKKADVLNEKIGELEDKVKRELGEFENFRYRTEKEKSAMFEIGAKSVIEKMLPVVDNFERGLSGLSEEEKEAPFASGMQMVYKQLLTELDSLGVKPIEAVGKEFDPNLHNAVMQVESEEYGSGTVAQEMMKGYTYRDSVVRHSMVAVVS